MEGSPGGRRGARGKEGSPGKDEELGMEGSRPRPRRLPGPRAGCSPGRTLTLDTIGTPALPFGVLRPREIGENGLVLVLLHGPVELLEARNAHNLAVGHRASAEPDVALVAGPAAHERRGGAASGGGASAGRGGAASGWSRGGTSAGWLPGGRAWGEACRRLRRTSPLREPPEFITDPHRSCLLVSWFFRPQFHSQT